MIFKICIILSAVIMYTIGELYKKEFKYVMGIPIAVFGVLALWSLIPIWCIVTYLIATEFGYGDNNLLTKILGKRGAITFCGIALGLASFPLIGYLAIIQGVISGISFYVISVLDDKDIVKEPFVAILRGFFGTILCIF